MTGARIDWNRALRLALVPEPRPERKARRLIYVDGDLPVPTHLDRPDLLAGLYDRDGDDDDEGFL